MELNIAAIIIPIALFFIGLEYLIARKLNKSVFEFNRTIANLSVGAAERLFNIFLHGSFYFLFKYVYDHYSLFSISNAWYNWVFLLFLTDFVWYWYHRLGHEVNLLWAFHIVHHQSEDYNLTTAARVTNFQSLVRSAFWSVLPFIGFKPEMVAIILVVHGGYSFFTHTEVIGKMGWLEKVLITPSHHRVHHASNPEYLDKNYGDIFVFWDKLFGTFKEEETKPKYGLTKSLDSYSFLWQHFHYLIEMTYRFSVTKGVMNKFSIIFGRPDVMKGDEREILEKHFLPNKTPIRPQNNNHKKYIVFQLYGVLISAFSIILFQGYLDDLQKTVGAVLVLLTLINCGALLEQRKWILLVEYLRVLLLLFVIGFYVDNSLYYIFCVAVSICVTINSSFIKQTYFRLLFNN